ncbi:MAG TPA: hypothetical protein VHA37_07050 [Candidatus Saccharimonadales bacterium]|nr:hypothetical protein [Candidatus Saccharimonadales bacterium]
MTGLPLRQETEDSVPKVDREIAVGENLPFMRKWWKFEHVLWGVLLLVVAADGLGALGRGWLAKARLKTSDGALTIDYEKIVRASTPTQMTFRFGPEAIHNGRILLFVGQSVVRPLGARRIAPDPAQSTIGAGGITYTFPAKQAPAFVEIEMEPSTPGMHHFRVQAEGSQSLEGSIFVLP